ncbi:tyrosine--tRNA ligase [Patescibacteria group bacterium]|nr:tyrosine--tRNA ligase [Patescibacteria group bacterium]
MKIDVTSEKIKEVLTRGVEKIYPDFKMLEKRMISGEKMRLYCGYDPSAPTLHLGHLITLKKLAQFQELGHEVIMLIGDFTGMIGDPTERLTVRRKLTRREVISNSKSYKKLASKILKFTGKNPARILYNSQWLDNLIFLKLIDLASNFTVQQIVVRDMFQKRIKKKRPIYLHEFLYPLAQAYDGLAMDVDLEIGGKDQTFNMLCGRDLMKALRKKEKFVLATKLLVDPTGKKMGKTEGKMISLDENPIEIYGKIMSWPDSLILPGLELLTNLPLKKVKEISKKIRGRKLNPADAKAQLAREIVVICHNKRAVQVAEREFNRVFKKKKLPSKILEIKLKEKKLNILGLLTKTKLARSRSAAKRLILQKGVKIDNAVEKDWRKVIKVKKGMIVQVGKRKFVRLI